MHWIRKKPKKLINIGLDINSGYCVMVVMQIAENSVNLMHKIIFRFEKCSDERFIGQISADKLQKTSLASFKDCVVAMPDHQVMTKVVQFDKNLSDYALDMLVWHEAEQQIGYPLTEINLDYQCLGTSTIDSSLNDVLLLASQKRQVDERIKIIKHLGLNAKRLDVESYALARVTNQLLSIADSSDNIIAIIYLNTDYITLSVWNDCYPLFIRTETIHVESDDSIISLVKEIHRLLQLYYATPAATKILSLRMAGQCVNWCELLSRLKQQFDIEIMLISSLLEEHYGITLSSEYVMAAALALSTYE